MNTFYLITPPHFEDLALKELTEKWEIHFPEKSYQVLEKELGGILIKTELAIGCYLNQILKIPTRIILRWQEIKCRDFPTVYQKALKLNWYEITGHPEVEFKITVHECRLMHTGRFEETLLSAYKEYQKRFPLKKTWEKEKWEKPTIYIRGQSDVFTISLDLSGEALYKRERPLVKHQATMRENFAAGLFYFTLPFLSQKDSIVMADPMCGSGTLLWEAAEFYRLTKRRYAYEHSPLHKNVLQMAKPRTESTKIKKIVGRDLNENLIKELPDAWKVQTIPQVWEHEDVSSSTAHTDIDLVLCNPPYDERLTMGLTYQTLIKSLQNKYPNALIGVLMSSQKKNSEKLKINPKAKLSFSNSGIDVDFYLI
jgi:putative N6-adenine-specific DNA methylase